MPEAISKKRVGQRGKDSARKMVCRYLMSTVALLQEVAKSGKDVIHVEAETQQNEDHEKMLRSITEAESLLSVLKRYMGK